MKRNADTIRSVESEKVGARNTPCAMPARAAEGAILLRGRLLGVTFQACL